jgi:hypothetical protein
MPTLAKSLSIFSLLFLAISVCGQSATDFAGHWRQATNSATHRQLEVQQNGKNLLVETIVTDSQGTRRLEVKYEIGGPQVSYTGLDGDQFRSSVHWDSSALVFDTIEHEDGKDLPQKTVWTLSADRNTLQIDRESTKSGKPMHSLSTYVRQSAGSAGTPGT